QRRDSSAVVGGLVVHLVSFAPSGGLYQHAWWQGTALARAGLQIVLLTGKGAELDADIPGFDQREILPTWHPSAGSSAPRWFRKARRLYRGLNHCRAWLRILRLLERERPDVVQFDDWRFPVDGWAVSWLSRRRWRPVI